MQEERITFSIAAEHQADLLARLVLLFHRLNVGIHGLSMVRKRDSATMHLGVTVDVEEGHGRRLEAHLYKLIHVRSVRIGRE
jgi:hypothetical protein